MMASDIRVAIKLYSIAVAADSSLQNRSKERMSPILFRVR
jgi:hypothetical protein